MAIYLDNTVKNTVLEDAFKPSQGVMIIELFYDDISEISVSDPEIIGFKTASNGSIEIATETDFIIEPSVNAIVNKIKVSRELSGGVPALFATIHLTGDDIKDFSEENEGGIYRLKTFKISI